MVRALNTSFLEEQLPGAECGFDDCLDERDTQLPFFEFEDTVNRANAIGYAKFARRL